MQGMADQIIDQDGAAADAQRLARKARQIGGLQMMREQASTDQIETAFRKGKRQRVRDHGTIFPQQVRAQTIEVSYLQRDSFARQLLRRESRHFAQSSRYFEYGEMSVSRCRGDALDQSARGGNPAEPAVDAADIPQ